MYRIAKNGFIAKGLRPKKKFSAYFAQKPIDVYKAKRECYTLLGELPNSRNIVMGCLIFMKKKNEGTLLLRRATASSA